jgi:hypothetical protein
MAMFLCRLLTVSSVCCLLVLPSLTTGKRDDLKDYKVDELGVSQTLWCNESVQYLEAPNDTAPISWMLPNLTVLAASAGKFIISDDSWSLQVYNITRDDLGQYHCMLRVKYNETEYSDWYLARLGLNAQGPYFEDLWDKYETNTIIGISAGFGFLALALGAMLVWHFRYISPPDEEDDKQNNGTPPYMAYGVDTKIGEPVATTFSSKSNEGVDSTEMKEQLNAKSDASAYSNAAFESDSDGQKARDNIGSVNDEGTAF